MGILLTATINAVFFRFKPRNEINLSVRDTPEGKQPYYFTRGDGQVITIAGVWDEWTSKETGKSIKSCAMLITSPNKLVAEVHNRMPVILEAKDFEQWERGDLRDAAALMKPVGEEVLQKWPVSKRVNSSRTSDDDVSLIETAQPT